MDDLKLETMTIEELGLCTRTYNALNRAIYQEQSRRIKLERNASDRVLVRSILKYTGKELVHGSRGVRGFGLCSLWELQKALKRYGLKLAGE